MSAVAELLVSDNDKRHIRHRCGVSVILAPPFTAVMTHLLTYLLISFVYLSFY